MATENLECWIQREVRNKAQGFEVGMARRLQMELAAMPEETPVGDKRQRLRTVLANMKVQLAVTGSGLQQAAKSERMWSAAREVWEQDVRPGYAWLVREQRLPVTSSGVRQRALRERWTKKV